MSKESEKMSKSKKPRKPYRKKYELGRNRNYFPKTDLDAVFSKILNWELRIEECLPRGNLTKDDFDVISALTNWGLIVCHSRKKLLTEDQKVCLTEIQTACVFALHTIKDRFLSGKSSKIVATGEELKTIREYLDTMFPFLKECVENTPEQTRREWIVAQDISNEGNKPKRRDKNGMYVMSTDEILKRIQLSNEGKLNTREESNSLFQN